MCWNKCRIVSCYHLKDKNGFNSVTFRRASAAASYSMLRLAPFRASVIRMPLAIDVCL